MGRKKKEETLERPPRAPRVLRIDKAYYLSENAQGTLDGTEWMTRAQYAKLQAAARMYMGEAAATRGFATSPEAVAYRAMCKLLDSKLDYGLNLVRELKGRRPIRKSPKKK